MLYCKFDGRVFRQPKLLKQHKNVEVKYAKEKLKEFNEERMKEFLEGEASYISMPLKEGVKR